jgi:hypothetical protein
MNLNLAVGIIANRKYERISENIYSYIKQF